VTWESAALLAEKGIDLRDPKLSITPDDRVMMTAGGSVYEGTKLLGRQPRVAFSKDGREWTAPQRVLSEGEWLWRVTWHGGQAFGVSYNASMRSTPAAKEAAETGKLFPGPADWKLKLVVSNDGVKYDLVTHLDVPGHPNETTLRFLPDGELVALVRREGGNTFGWIGRSRAPYTEWTWKETAHRLGGPNFIRLPDGNLWAAGRSYPGGAKCVLARMTRDGGYSPALTLPSGGDTSYPGLVWHNGELWMSYYSSHEGKSAIYLARISVPLDAENIGSRREPFVDDYLIDKLTGSAKLQLQQPTPREVVLTADKPWEGNTSAYYTVLADDDAKNYRMYYRGAHYDEQTKKETHREVTCYAESIDGIHWTKPELGLFDFNGSKQNNIVWDGPGTHCFAPFKDNNPKCSTDARFKAVTAVKGGLLPLKSADGIHWQLMSDKPVITKGAFDSQNLAFWDEHLGQYREYHRAFRVVRDIMTGTSDDFLTWTPPTWLDYPDA
ncbi:MAG TPA: sialidase family protein, partial [Planctomycetaceae bacterium]|nr:sialidase family protein [Planctomycetaceae bacterium]